MIVSYNKVIACLAPNSVQQEEAAVVNGVRSSVHRTGMTRLEVKYGNSEIPVGSYIYIPTTLARNQKWSSEIFDLNGDRLVFVPEQSILLVDRNEKEVMSWPAEYSSEVEKSIARASHHINTLKSKNE